MHATDDRARRRCWSRWTIGAAALATALVVLGCVFAGTSCGTLGGFIAMSGGVNPGSCDIQIGGAASGGEVSRAFIRCTPAPGPSGGYSCGQIAFVTLNERSFPLVPFSFPTVACAHGFNDPNFGVTRCYVQEGIHRSTGVRFEGAWPVHPGQTYYLCASSTPTSHYACQRFTA
jgi:hypothetical protein